MEYSHFKENSSEVSVEPKGEGLMEELQALGLQGFILEVWRDTFPGLSQITIHRQFPTFERDTVDPTEFSRM